MIDCNFLASFLSMYCKNSLSFKKSINKVIIIIIIIIIIILKYIIITLFHSYLYKIFTIKLLKKKELITIFRFY